MKASPWDGYFPTCLHWSLSLSVVLGHVAHQFLGWNVSAGSSDLDLISSPRKGLSPPQTRVYFRRIGGFPIGRLPRLECPCFCSLKEHNLPSSGLHEGAQWQFSALLPMDATTPLTQANLSVFEFPLHSVTWRCFSLAFKPI